MTTKALADFVASVQYDKLSPETVRITKQCILDWLGVCIRGSQEKPIQIIRKLLLDGGVRHSLQFWLDRRNKLLL